MRAVVIAMGALMLIGLIALPQAVETFTGVDAPEFAGGASAVWCGPDEESSCCGGRLYEKLGIRC